MPKNRRSYRGTLLSALLLIVVLAGGASGAFASGSAAGFIDEKVDPALAAQLASVSPETPLEVVIVFSDVSAAGRVGSLASTFYQMQALPMTGAVLSAGQIQEVANWPEIYSLTLNSPLEYFAPTALPDFLHESVATIRADQVWGQYGERGGNATVAVIDSGIDATHPDLLLGSNKVIQNVKILPFQVALEDQQLTDHTSGHGTHVAGTIAGDGAASDDYYQGVAPEAKLVGLGAGETLFILTAVQAYDWVLEHHSEYNIRVVSNSWGSTGGNVNVRNPIVIATFEAYKQGILSVFAAGNDGGYDELNPYSLAPWLLSVAAGKKDGVTLADFSSRGKDGDYFKHPDITAPGVDIYATRTKTVGITATDPIPNPVNPVWTAYYTALSGTSMATPHVSGVAALLFSSNSNLSPDQVMDLLTANARPFGGYTLHEAGYGYLDALAAYQGSLGVAGNLSAFLAGDQQHSIEEVLGFNPDVPLVFDEYAFTGLTPVGAVGIPEVIDHPFSVPEGVLYVDIALTWTPQTEDAYDMEVLDSRGRVVMSSGNGLEEGEFALFVPSAPGTYTLRLIPFVTVAAQYEARVKLAYGTPPANWPPTNPPSYDYYAGVVSVYKTYGVLGIGSEYFRGGDRGFIVFALSRGDGSAVEGVAANLQAIYTDRRGNIAFADNAIVDRDGGEYQTSFNTGSVNWKGVAGPIIVSFAWKGEGTMRAAPTHFFFNHLKTTLHTDAQEYGPGETISFSGEVAQVNTVTTGDIENMPLAGATVNLQLMDANGNALASTQVETDVEGKFQGALDAPAKTRGRTTLLAEATYEDPTVLLGPKGWYGKAEVVLFFPGNLPPTVSLYATPQTDEGKKFFIHISASASDPDGAGDIKSISLVLSDAKGRVLKTWSKADFTKVDDYTWQLEWGYRLSGKAPWTLTLTATDSAGQSATAKVVVNR